MPPSHPDDLPHPADGHVTAPPGLAPTEGRTETATRAPAPAPAAPPPERAAVPGYEVLGELGRGGMGVVYRARQTTLGRVVALKMILAGAHAGPDELARFRTEAEAIARLQHPGIVQIYEVGEHEGLPYFSLEFCPGGSLEKKLNGTPLPAAEAAALVQALARAVLAAHAKGVVHRDLKPANVLLAEDSTPKITDFGLAKKLDEAGHTASGAVLGTPSYMAPEQAGGRGKAVGPAADVYALGALLYECLTGRPPFKAATPLDTLLQVVSEEPVPPRLLQPQVPRDLETICLKCLHKDPERRYAGADSLAADLGRFRDGRPILARRIGPLGRLGRWVRRNPVVAGLTAASALLFLAGFAGVAWQWYRAERQRATAEQERARARAGFEQARLAVDEYFTTVSDSKLLTVPGLQPLRKELLEAALKYYQGFLEQHRDDPTVQTELAKAYFRVGMLRADLASRADAIRAYESAIGLLDAQAAAHPDDEDTRRLLATSLNNAGKIHLETEQVAEARPLLERALALRQELARGRPDDAGLECELAASLGNLGILQNRLGQTGPALASLQEALAIWRRQVKDRPDDAEVRNSLAGVLDSLGGVLAGQKRYREAAATFREAIDQERVAVVKAPQVFLYREWLGNHYFNLAVLQEVHLGRPAEALATRRQALDLWEQLARENPSVTEYQYRLAQACVDLGQLLREAGRPADPLPYFERARGLLEKAVRTDPGMAAYHSSLGAAWDGIAGRLREQGKLPEAVTALQEAIREQRKAGDLAPDHRQSRRFLAAHYRNLGLVQEALGRPAEARAAYEQACALLEQLARDEPANAEHRSKLADLWLDVGRCQCLVHDLAAALRADQRAVAVSEELVRASPADIQLLTLQGKALLNVALARLEMDRRDEGMRTFRQAADVFEKLVAEHPGEDGFQETLARSYAAVAGHRAHAGQVGEAIEVWDRARTFWEHQAGRHPTVGRFARELASACLELGELLASQGRLAPALRRFEEARDVLVKLDRQAPGTVETRHLLAGAHKSVGDAHYLLGHPTEALAAWGQARDVWADLVRAHPDNAGYQGSLGATLHNIGQVLATQGRREEALACLQQAIDHQRVAFARDPDQGRQWLSNHYQVLASVARDLGRPAPAAAASRERAKLWPRNADELYRTACEVALCIPLVGKGKADLTAAEQAQRRRYGEQALDLLRTAVRQGFHDMARLKKDRDLDALRSQEGFRTLLAELEQAR
jgi:tetratricopeptide (TPR) repeat protein/predicted Ser/Thr protein kinase